jgi:uncharacterized protein
MLHRFIGRKRELHLLNQLLLKKSASLIVIRGRRRIGKSRLVQEFASKITHYNFSGLPPTVDSSAHDQREEFARQLQRELKIPLPRADDWGDLFWHLAQHTQKGKIVIILDEISWMGFKDPNFLGKLKIAWDLYFKTNPQLILVVCGSISSWIEQNILSSTGFMGRISLDIRLEELSLAECNEFWNAEKEIVSNFDKFKCLSVTGGVPRYLEEILPNKTAEENIQRLCFQREGLLFAEFEQIFSDLFASRSGTYKKIVQRLAEGPCSLSDIYQALGVDKSGVISQYLDDLITSGFVAQDFTWHLKTGSESKLSLYRLKDNYLRFYLKYIDPNKNKIEAGRLKLPPQWQTIMGLQFENLVLNNRKALINLLSIDAADIIYDNPYFQRKTRNQQGCQIDYMIQTKFGSCYLCEIKYLSREVGFSVVEEVKLKIRTLNLPKHLSVRPVLIHVNGAEEQVIESGFFSSIVDFGDFLY